MNNNTDYQNWQLAKELFLEISELPENEQIAFVNEKTKNNPELRVLLEELLSGDDISHQPENAVSKIVGQEAQAILKQDHASQKGERIAEYEIEDILGEGGMGVVYLAHRKDAQFEQSVAIKIIQSHALVPQTLERFRQERQILASLQHPNIAQLVGGGETKAGLPYIVMEYIDGVNIIEYCQANKLNIEERLDLFKQVLNAINYAHQNLIIHRDIKPNNVMVTKSGVVKLLDFGIAKLIEEKALPADQNLTAMEVKVLTYTNASPEQVRKEKVTTRTDVYGLSALLYQMLTEKPLFDLKGVTNHELESWIIDKNPTKPSANLSEKHSAQKANLQSTLSGDLDTIILKGLQKEPDRRYSSVEQLTQDIQNYLTNYPILAKPDSTWYKVNKFYQRNRAFTIVTSAFAFCLMCFSIAVTYQAMVIDEARKVALRESNNAYQVTNFLTETFQAANPLYSGDVPITPLELIDNASNRIKELSTDKALTVQFTSALAMVYRSIGANDKALSLVDNAIDLLSDTDDVPETIKYEIQATKIEALLEIEGAETVKNESIEFVDEIKKAIAKESNEASKSRLIEVYVRSLVNLGSLYDRLGDDEKALEFTLESLTVASANSPVSDFYLHQIYTGLGHTYRRLLNYEKSVEMLTKSLSVARKTHGDFNLEVAYTLNQLASTYINLDRLEEAKEAAYRSLEIREALFPRGSAEIAASLGNLSNLYTAMGDGDKSLQYRQRSADEITRVMGPDHIYSAGSRLALAKMKSDMGQHESAISIAFEVLPYFEKAYSSDAINLARPYLVLGMTYYRQKELDKAFEYLERSMAICLQAKPEGHWLTGQTHVFFALTYHELDEQQKANEHKREAIKLYNEIFGEDSNSAIKIKESLSAIPEHAA